jgi:hypothetical protein
MEKPHHEHFMKEAPLSTRESAGIRKVVPVRLKEVVKKYFLLYGCLFLLVGFISRAEVLGRISLPWILLAVLLNIGFTLCKTATIYLLCREVREVSYFSVCRAFLKSVTIGIVTLTSKAGFLTSLFFHLGAQLDKKKAAWVVGVFIAANLAGFAFFLPWLFVLNPRTQILLSATSYLLVSCGIALVVRRPAVFGVIFFTILSYLINYLQISVIAISFHEILPSGLFRTIIVADLARVISHIPFGLGVLDGIFYWHFRESTAILNLPLFLIAVRLLGELLTAFWGLCVFGLEKVRN